MKNKKLQITLIFVIVIIFGVLAVIFMNRHMVQKGMEKVNLHPAWNKIMSEDINHKEINLIVDGKEIDTKGKQIYMSEGMELMIPEDIVIESFHCAKNLYQKKKFVIEKGSSKAVMFLGKKTLYFNDNEYEIGETIEKKDGSIYFPVSIFSNYFEYDYQWKSGTNTAILTNKAKNTNFLPERYSYIDEKRAVKAKNQGSYGTCWAFATLTALETSLMPEEEYDFSENNLIHNNELSQDIQDGGDYIMSMAYLMSWRGPVLEKDDPYGNKRNHTQVKPQKHVQGAEILPSKDYEQIKRKVYQYGGVESSMYMSMSNAGSKSVYYNDTEYAYCYRGNHKPNHDVVIVGWDDHYSKELFNDPSIEGDGAFICMNSWGEEFGYHGTFYVSYYDDCIGNHNVCYTDVESTDNYDNIYQSDLCGWTGTMGIQNQSTVYFANVFSAFDDEKLQAVGFYATTENLDYQVFVCENYKDSESLNNRNHIAAQGNIQNKGYYTIKLDKDYRIKDGKKFAVIVKISSKSKDGNYKIIPVEIQEKGLESKVDISDGEGYFSVSGDGWKSAENQKCNICLKAYTKK